MPSYAIHLAIANEMIRKNKNNIIDKEKLFWGSVMPDLEKTDHNFHKMDMSKFIEHGFKDDYDKGYFLHIITDYEFYVIDFKKEFFRDEKIDLNNHNNFYSDYNKLVLILVEKYKIRTYPKEIEKYMQGEEGELEYIKLEKLYKFIDRISDLVLDNVITELEEKPYYEFIKEE